MKNVCILIPTYNEEKAIGDLVSALKAEGLTVYVVDDGSTDSTAKIASSAGALVFKRAKNMGKGASLREGFRQVIDKGFEAVIVMDGDGQHLTSDVGHFVRMIEESDADIVIGNRMSDISRMPIERIYTNRFMSALISLFAGQRIPDSQSGFRLIKREVLEKIELESSNFEIESEMIIKASRAGFKIASVPIATIYEGEKSKINPIIDTLRFIFFAIKILFKRQIYVKKVQ